MKRCRGASRSKTGAELSRVYPHCIRAPGTAWPGWDCTAFTEDTRKWSDEVFKCGQSSIRSVGQSGAVVTHPHRNVQDVGSNPTATRNEKRTEGSPIVQQDLSGRTAMSKLNLQFTYSINKNFIGERQNSLPLTTNFSQNVSEPLRIECAGLAALSEKLQYLEN